MVVRTLENQSGYVAASWQPLISRLELDPEEEVLLVERQEEFEKVVRAISEVRKVEAAKRSEQVPELFRRTGS